MVGSGLGLNPIASNIGFELTLYCLLGQARERMLGRMVADALRIGAGFK